MTTFLLIRHAEYAGLGGALIGRTPGIVLNEAGRAQAQGLVERLGSLPITAIYSSPLERTLETAAPLAEHLGLPATASEDLLELDFGSWQGATFDQLRDDPLWGRWNEWRSGSPTPGGETMLAAQARIVQAMLGWQARYPDGLVALVSHSDMLKAALAHFLGMSLDMLLRIELSPASVSVLVLEPWGARVTTLNHTGAMLVV